METFFLDFQMRPFNKIGLPYSGTTWYTNEYKVGLVCKSLCIKENNEMYFWLLLSQAEIEPRWSVSSIRLIFVNGFLSDQLLVDLEISDTCILRDD